MTTRLVAASGTSWMWSGGETSSPAQVYRRGISSPSWNADEPTTMRDLPCAVGCGSGGPRRKGGATSCDDAELGLGAFGAPEPDPALPRDQSPASLVGDVGPGPLHHDDEAVAETDQVEDVDEDPHEPRRQAAHPELRDLRDGGVPPDRGEVPLVQVAERLARLALEVAADRARDVATHLQRRGRDAWDRPAVLALDSGQIARHEDVGVARDGQVGLDPDPAGAVEGGADRTAERRGGDAGSPDDVPRLDPLLAHHHRALLDPGDEGAGPNLDAERLELGVCPLRERLGVGREDPGTAFEEDD